MIIPESASILYKDYAIGTENHMRDETGTELYGQINYLEQTITLSNASSLEQKKAPLVHELIHGLDEMYNIGLKEKQVEKLGNGVYMLIRDNPEMFLEEEST